MYRVFSVRLSPIAMTRPATFERRTDPKARNSVLPSARILDGSWRIWMKLSSPTHAKSPMPVQSVKAKKPPTLVAT
jgi:hypothetical protein